MKKKLKNKNVTILNSSMTFENFDFPKSSLSKVSSNKKNSYKEIYKKSKFSPSEFTCVTRNSKDTKFSGIESSFSFTNNSKAESTSVTNNNKNNIKKLYNSKEITKSAFSSLEDGSSNRSFLTIAKVFEKKNVYESPKRNKLLHLNTLRLFDKHGKPLTDRIGRPLLDILGDPLVNIDDEGRLISDANGNQVFNSRGESAIYSTTNLHIPPSDEEPGIPLLDVDKRHVLFLYDNMGHPLTDSLGRPLLKASGSQMIGFKPNETLTLDNYINYELKTVYGKAPLENFVRRIQIFDNNLKPLTDESGEPLNGSRILCNKHGMPICDAHGHSIFFKYGTRISNVPTKTVDHEFKLGINPICCNHSKSSKVSFEGSACNNDIISVKQHSVEKTNKRVQDENKTQNSNSYENISSGYGKQKSLPFTSPLRAVDRNAHICSKTETDTCYSKHNMEYSNIKTTNSPTDVTEPKISYGDSSLPQGVPQTIKYSHSKQKSYSSLPQQQNKKIDFNHELVKHEKNSTGEVKVLYDASQNIEAQKSSSNILAIKDKRNGRIWHSFVKKKPYQNMIRSNFFQYFKNAMNLTNYMCFLERPLFNDYGKPMKDFYGNLLYDKYGIPLTGANGIKLSEKSRQILRLKLRNIPINKNNVTEGEPLINALSYNKSCIQYGDPYYDKYGRPLYDLFGKLIYDTYGRPLTDAFNRPLIDAIGQPLMDSKGNVLTSNSKDARTTSPVDIFGRHLYDKRGRALFDSYGRPRFDIFTKAIYDACGRPSTDANGNTLCDFLNKAIKPYPEKPLLKNARAHLPKYIDRILSTPSLHLVLKYSNASFKDVFGGPLFDDFGRPLYNKIGKPLYDKYGRPLYDKNGNPLCDQYGRPLSEEIRQSPSDTTSSVVDSLKLLKLTKESSMWMEIKRSQTKALNITESGVLDDAIIMKIKQPTKNRSTQYTYALTRVTTFTCGRQALEILEAPLSPATAKEMHQLPLDNKPLIMVALQRKRITRKQRLFKHK